MIPHPTQQDIIHHCAPFFKKYEINYFNFGRMYDDGTCHLFTTNQPITEFLFANKYPIFTPVPKSMLKDKFYYLLVETGQYSHVIHEVRTGFNVANGFDIFEVYDGYTDICCFGSYPDNNEIFNVYFNKKDIFENFTEDFKNRFLINMNVTPIDLPERMRLNFISSDCQKNTAPKFSELDYKLDKNKLITILSPREQQCLIYYLNGKTAKETATLMRLSYRTVEEYFINIKKKLGCQNKRNLHALLKNY